MRGDRVEDAEIFEGNDQDGQDWTCADQVTCRR